MSYLLFAGHRHYPVGGIKDMKHKAESVEECKAFFIDNAAAISNGSYIDNWAHIVDAQTLEIIATGWFVHIDGNLLAPTAPEWRDGDFDRWSDF
jgi:hypothetical protein